MSKGRADLDVDRLISIILNLRWLLSVFGFGVGHGTEDISEVGEFKY